jgi:hypothetical protein
MQAALDPNIAAQVDKWNELLPGVPANRENLQTLLRYVKARQIVTLGPHTQPSANLIAERKYLCVQLFGPLERFTFERATTGVSSAHAAPLQPQPTDGAIVPTVARKEFDLDEQGLHKAIVWAKYSLKRYREEGPCPDCCNNAGERPKKRLRAEKMPKCEECILKAALDM